MRNMSFMLTKDQFKARAKTVTRRLGWWNLKPGEIVMGVEKSQGLKKGEKIVRLGPIRIVGTRREHLSRMTTDYAYGEREVVLEGFPAMSSIDFCIFFVESHPGCMPDTEVNRIEFEYLDGIEP